MRRKKKKDTIVFPDKPYIGAGIKKDTVYITFKDDEGTTTVYLTPYQISVLMRCLADIVMENKLMGDE